MRGLILPRRRQEAIDFAFDLDDLTQMHRDAVVYHLSYPNGGGVPRTPDKVLGDLLNESEGWDCVGAIFTVLGADRVRLSPPWPFYVDHGMGYGYCNCDTAIQDADGPQLLFSDATKLPGGPIAGDIVVFGARTILGHRVPGAHGHIGLLVGHKKVLHCSPSNVKKYGRALAITDANIFLNRKDRRYLRYNHWAA